MFEEFKKFILRGNVLDLAVGVMIGAAFNKIVTSLVNDIVMPPIGVLLAGVKFSHLFYVIGQESYPSLEAAVEAGAPVIRYGAFINTIIEFLIIAFVVFLLVRQINRFFPKPVPPVTNKTCPYCKSGINKDATRCPDCTSELEEVA